MPRRKPGAEPRKRGRPRKAAPKPGHWKCDLCHRVLPDARFTVDRSRARGRNHRCRDCNAWLLIARHDAMHWGGLSASAAYAEGKEWVVKWRDGGYEGPHPRQALAEERRKLSPC